MLEAKDGVMEEQEEEIIYTEETETEQLEEIDEQNEEIVEIIEEIVVLEDEEEEDEKEEEDFSKLENITEGVEVGLTESQEEDSQEEEEESKVQRSEVRGKQVTTYDAAEDWGEDNDPLETRGIAKSKNSNVTLRKATVNGNKTVSNGNGEEPSYETPRTRTRSNSGEYEREMKIPRHDDDDSPHEIVKNIDNDLMYTVLGSKKQAQEDKSQNARYIKVIHPCYSISYFGHYSEFYL